MSTEELRKAVENGAATDAEIAAWAERHGLDGCLRTDARAAFEDAESHHLTRGRACVRLSVSLKKAVNRLRRNPEVHTDDFLLIEQALRDQEAEIAGYRLEEQRRIAEAVALESRAAKTEALLRECQQFLSTYHPADHRLNARITAHLGDKHG